MYWLRDAARDTEFLLLFQAKSLALAFQRAGRPAPSGATVQGDVILILVLTSSTGKPVRLRVSYES
jgi:hypothetical protein